MARGIDLSYIGGIASDTHGVARERARTAEERRLGMQVTETASGRQTRVSRRPAFSFAELAQAASAGQIGAAPWLAVRYSVAGDASCVDELRGKLVLEAQLIARRESWPPRVMGLNGRPFFYRELVAQLVLDQDVHRHYFTAAPTLHGIYMGVCAETWSNRLEHRFDTLKGKYLTWIDIGRSQIQRALRGQ